MVFFITIMVYPTIANDLIKSNKQKWPWLILNKQKAKPLCHHQPTTTATTGTPKSATIIVAKLSLTTPFVHRSVHCEAQSLHATSIAVSTLTHKHKPSPYGPLSHVPPSPQNMIHGQFDWSNEDMNNGNGASRSCDGDLNRVQTKTPREKEKDGDDSNLRWMTIQALQAMDMAIVQLPCAEEEVTTMELLAEAATASGSTMVYCTSPGPSLSPLLPCAAPFSHFPSCKTSQN